MLDVGADGGVDWRVSVNCEAVPIGDVVTGVGVWEAGKFVVVAGVVVAGAETVVVGVALDVDSPTIEELSG